MNPLQYTLRHTALAALFFAQVAVAAGDDVVGTWLIGDKDGWVEISLTDDGLSGIIIGSPIDDPERSTIDDKNPDPKLRTRELIGLELFEGFEFDGKDKWHRGKIYDPNRGKTYKCFITIVDANTLKVRGYVGVTWVGRTETWTRKVEAKLEED